VRYDELPILRVSFPASATDEELARYCEFNSWLWRFGRDRPTAVVVDLSSVTMGRATQRRMIADNEDWLRAQHATKNAGVALVVKTRLLGGFFTAVHWLSPPTCGHGVLVDPDVARRWSRGRLEARSATGGP
jgi:hypothetical protein